MIYSQERKLRASMCGNEPRLSCIGAFALVEDTLTELMGELKIDGVTARREYNATWLFTKNHMKFIRPLEWNELFTVEGYFSKRSKVRMWIDVCVKNAEGEVCVYSRVEICGIDLDTERIRRVDTIGVDESVVIEPSQCEMDFFGKDHVETVPIETVSVRSSNIDFNHHTNNLEYIRFLVNTFTVEEMLEHPIWEMEVSYLGQSFEGDVLEIRKCELPGRAVLEIAHGDAEIIKCDMRFAG